MEHLLFNPYDPISYGLLLFVATLSPFAAGGLMRIVKIARKGV